MRKLRVILVMILSVLFTTSCSTQNIKSVEVTDLQTYIDEGYLFVDVREYKETPKFSFPNLLQVPTSELKERWAEIPKDKKVLIFCRSGKRSAATINFLQGKHDYDKLLNVKGGAIAIAKQFPQLVK